MLHRSALSTVVFLLALTASAQEGLTPSAGEGVQPVPLKASPSRSAQTDQVLVDPAQGLDTTARRVRALADELKSPFCPGKTVNTCTSYQAFELRREIRELIDSGLTDAQVVALLQTRHGDEISNPKQPWYTFFVPFLPFIVLAGLIFWVVQKWRKPADEGSDIALPEASEHLSRLREQVRIDSDDFNS